MATDLVIHTHRDLTQLRIKLAIGFVLIWGVFFALLATGAAEGVPRFIGSAILVAVALAFYFLGTVIALWRHHQHRWAIFALNLLAGWTFVGWVVAIVWACLPIHRGEGEGD